MIALQHLAFVNSTSSAGIAFGPGLTIVRGPSDTGKSFIVDAIDFMLGSKTLKDIPEREGYHTVLLGILLDGVQFTLTRSVVGGSFSVYEGLHTDVPQDVQPRVLSGTHNAATEDNLSTWLLSSLGLAGAKLRTNVHNATTTLSFRDLAHITVIDETSMQAEVPPTYSGRPQSKTREISVLKLLLTGDDDSNLTETPQPRDLRRLRNAKLEVLDQLVGDLERRLGDAPSYDDLNDQVARLTGSIEDTSSSLQDVTRRRRELVGTVTRSQVRARAVALRLDQIATLRARFGLLRDQYDSDLQRLALVLEGGTLLSFFSEEHCPLCGAAPEHQHPENPKDDATTLMVAAQAEIDRVARLRADLDETFSDLDEEERRARVNEQLIAGQLDELNRQLIEAESSLVPSRNELSQLMDSRSAVEATLGLRRQLAELERVRIAVETETAAETAAAATSIGVRSALEFSDLIRKRLDAWGYPEPGRVEYDRAVHDIRAGDQYRSAHGKGVRSILHAAFTIGLQDYCITRANPHPGFVVLDSPLITYRAPDNTTVGLDSAFAERFYRDLSETQNSQIIVMENTDPPGDLQEATVDVQFSKDLAIGRYGFFPAD
ncbi:hypothetical protein [Rathayibacter sp. VKM Ac-2927]|uniref:hypothetical protein n=1 Tax=Rathayibacter sp. VKM Ac-2927 TaxID=2929478 RepID=UPI001FB3A1B1|nr:hypothetical protein [Rathayibacter sp. VKM Ac-2927]MCJ1688631.1 hypothetical protein [Rathayibacter sp. VKM Ac-2927]